MIEICSKISLKVYHIFKSLERRNLVPPETKFWLRDLIKSLELQNVKTGMRPNGFRRFSSTDNGLLKPETGNYSNNFKDSSDINSTSKRDVEDYKDMQDTIREEVTENVF